MMKPLCTRFARLALGAAICLVCCAAGQAAAAPVPAPLPPEAQRALREIPPDPAPRRLIRDHHYFVSNEHHPERFRLALADLGGILVGVGAEQSYLFAGWAKPEVLVLLDFDQFVVDLHQVYLALLQGSPDPQAFIRSWSQPERQRAEQLLAASVAAPDLRRVTQIYVQVRPYVLIKLQGLRHHFNRLGVPCVLTDEEQYAYLRGLARAHRIYTVRGDLTGRLALPGLARAARQLGLPVRGIYLSNVEDYFGYASGLGANLLGLPFDDRSLIFRTFASRQTISDYQYVVQRPEDLRAWLRSERPRISRLKDILDAVPLKPYKGALYLPGPQPAPAGS